MNDAIEAFTRRIDSGAPLVLWDPPPAERDEGVTAYIVSTWICDNPECTCTDIHLGIRRARDSSDEAPQVLKPMLNGVMPADGSDLSLTADTTGNFSHEVTEWIRAQLSNDKRRAWFRERWRRVRGQVGDPAYADGGLPEVDGLVSFNEVFPYDFDLTVVHERRPYLADDLYCIKHACTCDELSVRFLDLSNDGEDLGRIITSAKRLRSVEIEGEPLVRQLWDAFLEEYGPAPLQKRFRRMRAALLSHARKATQDQGARIRVGRNDPCPCGSGKKFKRCCLGSDDRGMLRSAGQFE